MSTETRTSFSQRLMDKKVPQYIGTYFALGFALLQFTNFLTNRYGFNSSLVDKYLLLWIGLIPAVLTLVYFGGKLNPVTSSGTLKWPKFLVMGNVLIAGLFAVLFFNGNTSSTTDSEVLELTNETGKKVTAVVPSMNKVKTAAIFQFENLTGDSDLDWWGVAFSDLLMYDLEQRPEFYVYSALTLNGYYDRLGLKPFSIPNVGMQREIAQKSRNDYFSRISYNKVNEQFILKGQLYSSRDGHSVMELQASHEDPYIAIDEIKDQITANIPNAFEAIENQVNLPASSLISSNPKALQYYIESRIAFNKNPGALDEVVRLAKLSFENDPTCSLCHFYTGDPLYGQGRKEEALSSLRNAIKFGASLPERMQFGSKGVLYSITNKMDNYIKLQQMRRKMFPYEFGPYLTLLPIYKADYGIDSAKALIQEAIDNGNIERGLLKLYELQRESEEYEAAEKTLNRFTTEFPDREEDKLRYATLYEDQGKIEEAKEVLLKAETLDPFNTNIQNRLAYLDFRNHNVAAANERIEQGLQQASSLTDSLRFLWSKADLFKTTGQIKKAFEAFAKYEESAKRRVPLNRLLMSTLEEKYIMYLSIGQMEKIDKPLTDALKYSPEKEGILRCNITTAGIMRNFDRLLSNEEYTICQQYFQDYGEGYNQIGEILIAYAKENYEGCLASLEKDNGRIAETLGKSFTAKVYYHAGKQEMAKEMMQKVIDKKTDYPVIYYHMATFLEKDDPTNAKKYINIALQYWANADADFIPLQRAQVLASRLAL